MLKIDNIDGTQRSPSFDAALKLNMRKKAATESLKWGCVNFTLCFLLGLHIWQFNGCYNMWWYILECTIAGLCSLNFLAHVLEVLRFVCQKRYLLSFEENVVEPTKVKLKEENNTNAFLATWSSYLNQPKYSRKYNQQNSTPQRRGSPTIMGDSSPNVSRLSNNCTFNSSYTKYSREDFISDEESLNRYLEEFEEQEKNSRDESYERIAYSQRSFGPFMNTASFLLKTSAYQLSPLISETPANKEHSRDSYKPNFSYINSDILMKKSPEQLSQYVANLRKWIAITILHRLVREIDNINDSFKSRGIIEMEIGNIGLERLKKTAENQQFVNQYMPMLPLILPFLEISSNQEYLLQRIKDLASGYYLADYRWNSGSSYHGLKWDEHLPTDSSIVFHLLCVYLDTQLMPLPQGGGRPFFSRYVVMNDEKRSMKDILDSIQNRAHCAIMLRTNPLQPKFNFISDKKVHNCVYDRNNLFYVIIQFLIYMKEHHDGLLEGVHLGRNGINILCVIGE